MDVQLFHFIKVLNPFYPSILTAMLVQVGMDKWMDDKATGCWIYRAVMGGSEFTQWLLNGHVPQGLTQGQYWKSSVERGRGSTMRSGRQGCPVKGLG